MNDSTLQLDIRNPQFAEKFRTNAEVTAHLTGRFKPEKVSWLHTATLEDGSRIVLRFTNTIRYMLDSKLQRRTDRQSYLSYMELCVFPVGMKAYCKVYEPKMVLIEAPTERSAAKHAKNIQSLKDQAAVYGISLDDDKAWSTVFNENFKK